MPIGRTEDPESPLKPVTLEATRLFGIGSRTPSGPRQQAEHMIAIDLPVRILFEVLEPYGPFSNRGPPVNSLLLVLRRFDGVFVSRRK